MPRAVRWRFTLRWILILIAVLITAQFVLARLVRSTIRTVSRQHAAVDVGAARVSLLGRRVTLRNVAVADPTISAGNLVEIDRCDMYFDAAALLHKRAVIDDGTLTGIRFSTSSRLPTSPCRESESGANAAFTWLDAVSAQQAHSQLDRLHEKFSAGLIDRLESIRLTKELVARVPDRNAELQSRVERLHERTADFQNAVRKAQTNPLRHADFLERMPDEIKSIQDELARVTTDVEILPGMLDADRRAIVAARQHDERFLREHLRFERIDPNLLTAYLLQEQLTGPLADMLHWLCWMRQVMPAESRATKDHRGEDVFFAGCTPAPDLLIRSLDLRGTVRVGGRQFELLGTLTNLANQPRRHDQPLRIRLATAGPLPLEVQATLDRTGPVARDQLLVDCGGIVLPALQLGQTDKLQLHLAPASGTLNLSLALEGDRLSGDVQLVQRNVAITPAVAHGLARAGVDQALEESLAHVRSLATRVSLRGTLAAPQCQLWSNIGPAAAEALDIALAKTAESYRRQLIVEARQAVDEQLAALDRCLCDQQASLFPQLVESRGAIATIAVSEERPPRLSIEHLGRRLPADSLFR